MNINKLEVSLIVVCVRYSVSPQVHFPSFSNLLEGSEAVLYGLLLGSPILRLSAGSTSGRLWQKMGGCEEIARYYSSGSLPVRLWVDSALLLKAAAPDGKPILQLLLQLQLSLGSRNHSFPLSLQA